jgi:hypothetical protein
VCLTQCGGRGVGIFGLRAAAGKADLAGVVGQVVGALRQQHRDRAALDQRNQDRRVHRLAVDEAAL